MNRGQNTPGRGDITGRKMAELADKKAEHEQAKKATQNALISGEPSVLVQVPSGRTFLIPREAHDAIVARVEELAARGEGSA